MAKGRKEQGEEATKLSMYTVKLSEAELERLDALCDQRGFQYYSVDYSLFAYKAPNEKVNIVAYKSGKVVIQGKGTEEFVRDTIEAQITGVAELGYDEVHHPEWYEAHAGIDEAGKGDLFGPLISCCVIADGDMVRAWKKAGVKDSKAMTDGAIRRLESLILKTKGVVVKKTFASMERYNELMAKPRANLNQLLAWYHSKSIQGALSQRQVEWGLLDQFSKLPLTQRQLKKDGCDFDLRMRTHAEEDPVVAAASICARAEYLRQLEKLSESAGEPLLKGSGEPAKKQAIALVQKYGAERLGEWAKLHFKTAYEARGLTPPEKPAFFGARKG